MKITKRQLRRIIKEEIGRAMTGQPTKINLYIDEWTVRVYPLDAAGQPAGPTIEWQHHGATGQTLAGAQEARQKYKHLPMESEQIDWEPDYDGLFGSWIDGYLKEITD